MGTGSRFFVALVALILGNCSVEGHANNATHHPRHHSPKAASKCSNGVVVCYYGMWAVNRGNASFGISDIPTDLCTHLIYSFIGPKPDGSVDFLDLQTTVGNKTNELKQLASLKKKNPNIKLSVAIGGWTESSANFTLIVNNATLRTKFVNNLYDFVVKYELDGADIDWEYPAQRGGVPSDKEAFVETIKELKEKFGDLLVTAAVAATQSNIDLSYDVPSLNKYLDYINVMTYDLHGAWDGVTGSIAPLYDQLTDPVGGDNLSANKSIVTWEVNGALASKIVLGIPTYGKTFTLTSLNDTSTGAPVTGAGDAGPYTAEAGTYAYYEICEDQQANPSAWNITTVSGNYAYANKDLFWVGYDNNNTAHAKGQYARKKGLAGVMYWAVDLDDFKGTCGPKFPIISASREGFCSTN